MSLGTRTLLGLGASFTLWSALLYVALAWLLRPSFDALERRAVERDTQRVHSAIAQQVETIASKVGDWSLWDDTWNFLATRDPEFVRVNLNAESLATLQIDFLVFVDRAGNIVEQAFLDDERTAIVAPRFDTAALLRLRPRLLRHLDATSYQAGLLAFGGQRLLLASRPVHRSDRSGEARGTLLAGARLDQQRVRALEQLTHLQIEITDPEVPAMSTQIQLDDERIRARTALLGLFGQPVADVLVAEPRAIHAEGEQALRLVLLAMLASSALALLTTLLGIDSRVLRRLRRMRATLLAIARTGDLSAKVAVDGGDEIADLGRSFNALTDQLQGTQRDLLRADRARTQFLANVSHEVRTPVTALIGFADLLLDPDLSATQRTDFVQTIARNGRHLLSMLNDLLDSAKLQSGQMGIELLPTDLGAMLHEVIVLVRPAAQQKGLHLDLVQEEPLPVTITTDPTRLRQILANLLGNAIKFTERGSVVLRAGMAGPHLLRFGVVDTGIGIDPEAQQRLFEPFAQADASTSRRYGGTGLGLMLSRTLARKLGGDVVCASEPGRGSTFTATIDAGTLDGVPRRALGAGAQQPAADPPPGRPLAGVHVLVADDAPDNRRLVSFLLRRAGAEVATADNGATALDCAAAALPPYDLVVLDMQMPVLDGYAAATELRRRGFAGPIVALTASAMATDRERCLLAGCTDYATKPIEAAHFVERLAALLHDRAAASAAGGPAA